MTKHITLKNILLMALLMALFSSLRHVAYAFSIVNGGSAFFAYMGAISVDLGLFTLAWCIQRRKAANKPTRGLWVSLIVFSAISVYANWIDGVSHQQAVPYQEGNQFEMGLIAMMPIVLSATLPLMVMILAEVWAGIASDEAHVQDVASGVQDTTWIDEIREAHVQDVASGVQDDEITFTERQRNIMRMRSDGVTNADIAKRLGVSQSTVSRETKRLNGAMK